MNYLQFSKNIAVTIMIVTSQGLFSQNALAVENTATAKFSGNTPKDIKGETVTKKLPQPFQYIGVVRAIDLGERSIEISGNKHFYGINVKVHTKDSRFSSVTALTQNTLIGFNATRDVDNRRIIQEIWVQPKLNLNVAPSDM